MKKNVLVLMIVVLSMLITFSSCNNHEHSFGSYEIVTEPECEKDGKKIRTCECGEEEEEIIKQLGHNFVNGVCTDCGKEEK